VKSNDGGSGSRGEMGGGMGEVGVGLEVVSALLFMDQGKTELEGAGDGEGDEDAGLMVL
jgi:hypothetical protein